jgi:hypothetical protein
LAYYGHNACTADARIAPGLLIFWKILPIEKILADVTWCEKYEKVNEKKGGNLKEKVRKRKGKRVKN